MIYKVQPPADLYINTSVQLPASKSISNRVLILNALSKNDIYFIENLSDSDDTQALQYALQSDDVDFDIGAAGTSMRFLTAYLSQRKGNWSITGTERMKNRPIWILTDALCQLGAEISFLEKKGFPPLYIVGKKLRGGSISLDGGISSQYISALMMIAPVLEQGLTMQLEGIIISRPYIGMTIRLMEVFGIRVEWEENIIWIRPQLYHMHSSFKVESDWSAASYWYEIIALASKDSLIELLGLEENSIQGDAQGRFLFEKLGVQTMFDVFTTLGERKEISTTLSPILPRFTGEMLSYNFVNEPDLVQTFVVSCCLLNIPFCFKGLQSLRIKETDRITALQKEMRKLGYLIRIKDCSGDTMEWKGERCKQEDNPVILTYEDHRMAMAFAPVCLKLKKISIDTPEVVSKSYPNYWRDLEQAGFIITNCN